MTLPTAKNRLYTRNLSWDAMPSSRAKRQLSPGYIDIATESASERKKICQRINDMPLRDEAWTNEPDCRGRVLHFPPSPLLTTDGYFGKCYLPALTFCSGLSDIIPGSLKKCLKEASVQQLNEAIASSKLELVKIPFSNNCQELLSRTAGTFMLAGKYNGHLHWAGLDCFKGVMSIGNGAARFLEPGDLETREKAKAFFTETGFSHISQVFCLRRLPSNKTKKKKRKTSKKA
jgi:hypothetical protein